MTKNICAENSRMLHMLQPKRPIEPLEEIWHFPNLLVAPVQIARPTGRRSIDEGHLGNPITVKLHGVLVERSDRVAKV